jgi:hypothetical protein
MKTLLTTAALATLAFAGAPSAATSAKPLAAHQDIALGRLLLPSDRVGIRYRIDTPGVKAPTGTLYVRNDLRRRFQRVALTGKAPVLTGRVPARLLRGHKLFYYAVIREPKSGRSVRLPNEFAWILHKPVVVDLGANKYGGSRAPEAVVARAAAGEVGWDITESFHLGPQTFQIAGDGSVWLQDSFKNRLLGWDAGKPGAFARAVPLPGYAAQGDVAVGPGGTLYATAPGDGRDYASVLFRFSTTGQVLWSGALPDELSFPVPSAQMALRVGPDGTLYSAVGGGIFDRPGGEQGWMPVATPDGQAIPVSQQRRHTVWGAEPLAGGLRLVSQNFSPDGERVRDARVALVGPRGRVLRSWRIAGRGLYGLVTPPFFTPELVGGQPVVLADVGDWTRVALRLGPHGSTVRFPLRYAMYGEGYYGDLKLGPDGKLYQLATSPSTGVEIRRYSLEP